LVNFGSSIRNIKNQKILFSNGEGRWGEGRADEYVATDDLLLS